jgi:hypothetical protein
MFPSQIASISTPIFPKFNALPTELRLMIWRYSLSTQILRMSIMGHTYVTKGPFHGSICFTKPPTLFSVNRESRIESLKSYVKIPAARNDGERSWYFSASLDTPYVIDAGVDESRMCWFSFLYDMKQHKMRSLAMLDHEECWPRLWWLDMCKELETIFLVGEGEGCGRWIGLG